MNRFWSKVDVGNPDECWEWKASKRNKQGYGCFSMNRKNESAHRVAWELINGKIPKGIHVLHRCDNTGCVNPVHLFLGTHQDNMRDRDKKERRTPAIGSNHGLAKLTEKDIPEIRKLFGKLSMRKIAKLYGVSDTIINYIKIGKTWRHIP